MTQGIAIVRLLRQLEARTGRRVAELFDLICGTSTGGILAVALALCGSTLDECEAIYRCWGAAPSSLSCMLHGSCWQRDLHHQNLAVGTNYYLDP